MSVLYSDNDGFFISHQLFISELYDTILNKSENIVNFYEHFFHIHNAFVRDKQQDRAEENAGVKRKRKRLQFKVIFLHFVRHSFFGIKKPKRNC